MASQSSLHTPVRNLVIGRSMHLLASLCHLFGMNFVNFNHFKQQDINLLEAKYTFNYVIIHWMPDIKENKQKDKSRNVCVCVGLSACVSLHHSAIICSNIDNLCSSCNVDENSLTDAQIVLLVFVDALCTVNSLFHLFRQFSHTEALRNSHCLRFWSTQTGSVSKNCLFEQVLEHTLRRKAYGLNLVFVSHYA